MKVTSMIFSWKARFRYWRHSYKKAGRLYRMDTGILPTQTSFDLSAW